MAMTRKTFLFPPEGIELLAWLRTKCEVKTDAEVVRYAIGALTDLLIADQEGKTVVFRGPKGEETIYHPVFEGGSEPEFNPVEALERYRGKSSVAA